MNKAQILWVQKGYQIFAWEGPLGLKVERLAKAVGKSKSSFYHFFADLDIFTDNLLKYNQEQSNVVADKEAQSTTLKGKLDVLDEQKIDLLFSPQLRNNRQKTALDESFTKINDIKLQPKIPIWSDING
ncbi:MAG: TetR/AcrR family transcriptional regulator [Cyclobacteriaceae bacterium]